MGRYRRLLISLIIVVVLGAASLIIYFKVIDYRDQVICTTDDRTVNLNFGKIDGVSVLYFSNSSTYIYFETSEDRQNFIKLLVESEYFDKIYDETDYYLIKDGYVFRFNIWYPDFITCNSYKNF